MAPSDPTGKEEAPTWTKETEKGWPIALSFIVGFFKLLGPRLTHGLTYFIVWFYYLTDGKKRVHVHDYLKKLHDYKGEKSPFAKEPGFWEAMKLYQSFGEIIVDRFTLWVSPESKPFEIEWEGRELLLAQLETGRGALLLSSHFGNIEALRATAQEKKIPLRMLMFMENAKKYMNMLAQVNPEVMDHLICMKALDLSNIALLQRQVEEGNLIGLLADRITEGAQSKITKIPWLGKEASFPQGPFLLATILQIPVYTLFVFKSGPKKYNVEVRNIFDGEPTSRKQRQEVITQMQQDYVAHWERLCTQYPYQWFNFYNFWKT